MGAWGIISVELAPKRHPKQSMDWWAVQVQMPSGALVMKYKPVARFPDELAVFMHYNKLSHGVEDAHTTMAAWLADTDKGGSDGG